uniref:4Fe-4S ferredoxin-type domain-containing protein n=1 Tax=Macrostomum lignano TaxID=282301 RepID=A0A1I8GIG2_9PLAT
MASSDKDFRFMATNDLMQELQRDSLNMDDDSEKKIVRMLLSRLEDQVGEVQNLAVKCLGPLVLKVKEAQVEHILDYLCKQLSGSPNPLLKDTSAIGLKTIIAAVPPTDLQLQAQLCRIVTPSLLAAIDARDNDASQLMECLEILADLLAKFGSSPHTVPHHGAAMRTALGQLDSSRQSVRKKAVLAIAQLVLCCSQTLFDNLMTHFRSALAPDGKPDQVKTAVQCLGAVSRQARAKCGPHLTSLLPLVIHHCQSGGDSKSNDIDDELREFCLACLEACVRSCPKESASFVPKLLPLCLQLLRYDPNYSYDNDDNDDAAMPSAYDNDDEQQGASDDDDEDDAYSDDDDLSWKVRRGAAKTIQCCVLNYMDMLPEFYDTVAPVLIQRFIEREENVKAEVFQAFIALLTQTRNLSSITAAAAAAAASSVPSSGSADDRMDIDESSPARQLAGLVPAIVQNLHRALRHRSVRTRSGAFHILRELCGVLPGCLSVHLGHVLPGLRFTINDKSVNNTKIDAIQFLNTLLRTHTPETFYSHLPVILTLVLECVKDPFYRICSEALLAATILATIIRPFEPAGISPSPDHQKLTSVLYPEVKQVLVAIDKDQEVKDRSISCVASILYHSADCLQAELQDCLTILCNRLQNEVTRLTANQCIETMGSLLRKNQRSLRIQTLLCLQTLFSNYSSQVSQQQMLCIIEELPPLISGIETDVASSQQSVALTTVLLQRAGALAAEPIRSRVLPVACSLAYSHHLHGGALDALLDFFGQAVLPPPAAACTDGPELLQTLLHGERGQTFFAAPVTGAMRNEVYFNLARCTAQITVHCSDSARSALIRDWIALVTAQQQSADSRRLFALLTLGEIGKHVDLSPHQDLSEALSAAFHNPQEEWQTGAAAIALGKISLGNLGAFVPYILNRIGGVSGSSEARNHYFMLHALKEIISHVAAAGAGANFVPLQPHVPQIWSLLERSALSTEEGARNLVSECLGKLALLDSAGLLPRLSELLTASDDSPLMLSTVLTAIKFCFIPQAHPADRQLKALVPRILDCLGHADLTVRRAALVAINTGVHNKTALIRDHLDTLLPRIYKGTAVDESLIRVINMGPFSHKEDAGLDLRKVTFECLYTLVEHCVDRIDLFTFIQHIEVGLKDVADIRILCFLILERLCSRAPSTVFAATEALVPAIRATFAEKSTEKSVRAELDKQIELKHAAMRVFLCLAKLGESKA